MMNYRRLFVLLIFPLLASTIAAKDINVFSGNTEAFIKELAVFAKQSNNKALITAFHTFEQKYKNGLFSNPEVERIIETSNLLIKNKIKANPFFKNYLLGLTHVKTAEHPNKHFEQWHTLLIQLLVKPGKAKLKVIKKLLAFSPGLFEQGALRMKKGKVSWYARNANYDLSYQQEKICIQFHSLDLVTHHRGDSLSILATKGTYCPLTNTWKGRGGKIQWNKPGMEEVYCLLGEYETKLEKGGYEIASAQLNFPKLFPGQLIEGTLQNKIVANNRVGAESYPRFTSKEKVLEITEIAERVNYRGGFRLHGNTYFGYGNAEQKAQIQIFDHSKKLIFQGKAVNFKFKEGQGLSSEQVEVLLFYGQDTISHPSVNLKYDFLTKIVNLYRGKRGSDRSPFYNSFHKIYIDTDKLDWEVDTRKISINQKNAKIGNGNQRVSFESLDYFDLQSYRKFQNVASNNPIAILKFLSLQEKRYTFPAQLFAQKINPRFEIEHIKSLLYDLLAEGFIEYNSDTQQVKVLPKALHFADASQGKKDFDIIKYVSKSKSTNALIDVEKQEIHVRDIKLVEFSNRQKVAAQPYKGFVTLLKDRDVNFDGKVFAGYASLIGKDFNFKYQNNEIQLDSVRYFDLFVPSGRKVNGEEEALSIASRIEHTRGVLLIDAPANKSGKQDIPMFPSFTTKGPAYVYYDTDATQGACYHRDSFYFELDPFSFNHLDQYTAADLKFKGKMISADIFPEIRETLVLQEDHSLGFANQTPTEGLPTYGGKGLFTGAVHLNNEGFLGQGQIKYRWATVESDDIVFKPEQLLSSADNFTLTEERNGAIEIPDVKGEEVSIDWKPYTDSMYVQAKSAPFRLFNSDDYTLKDMLILTPGGLKGRGVFDWEKGKVNASLYSIGAHSIQSDTSNLVIRTSGLEHLALDTRNVYSRLDFDLQIGTVGANADTVETILPYNTYITSLNEFDWDMANKTITFKADENGEGSFRSINPEQDSLQFFGKTAFYDLKTYELKLGGVTHIETADATVYPFEDSLEIQQGGVMTTLENAKIVANRSDQYHLIDRATVDILGKNEYRAKGFYQYDLGVRKQSFELQSIVGGFSGKGKKQKQKIKTTGIGEVGIEDQFYIDHQTLFHGKIALDAEQKALQFAGFARLDASLLKNTDWFSISCPGDKNDLYIDFVAPKNPMGQRVRNGLCVGAQQAELYPLIMKAKDQAKDRLIFEANGLLDHKEDRDVFSFGDSLKVIHPTRRGNLLTFNDQDGEVTVEGRFNLLDQLPYAQLTTIGRTSTNVNEAPRNQEIEAIAGLDLYIPEKLLKIIMTDILANGYEARNVKYLDRKDFYNMALAELIPSGKDFANSKAKMLNYGLDLPEQYNPFSFLFTELYLQWNPETRSFKTYRQKSGLASIGDTPINKMLDLHIECRMPSNGNDRIAFWIQSPGEDFYYFDYQAGILNTVSSNEAYNEAVEKLKKKEQSRKMEDGELYEIQLTSGQSAQQFLRKF